MFNLDRYLEEIQKKMFYPVGSDKDVEQIPFEGKTLYTSQNLKENVKKSVQKYLTKQTSEIIIKEIDNGKILPVFLTKGIVDYIIKRRKFKSHSLGTAYKGKAFIFIDRLYERFKITSVNEKKLASIVLHELIHTVEHLNRPAFVKINYKLFITFWKEFFREYLSLKGNPPDKIFEHIIKYQFSIVRAGKTFYFSKIYDPIFKQLESYSSLILNKKDVYDLLLDDLLDFSESTFDRSSQLYIPPDIADAKNAAYMKIAKSKSEVFGQEMWNPSEILSVVSEIAPNHPNVIKTLKIL